MVQVATCMDTIGANAGNIPSGTPFVGVYVSGLGSVPWSADEQKFFPLTRQIRIYQGSGTYPGLAGYDMIDVESGAVTVAQCASEVEKRVMAGYEWTVIYGTDATLASVASAIEALGDDIFPGHVAAFLADWNLNETKAEALLGTSIHGIGCVGVQWASPYSNPNTQVPGGVGTLKSENIDLSVVDASFFPVPGIVVPAPPVAVTPVTGMVVYESATGEYISENVQSTDGTKTWTSVA